MLIMLGVIMENKKMYNRCKMMSKLYNIPLYISWKCRYFPHDIQNYIKYGYK